ncbi:hypothetical protein [Arthrobacter sp. ISL-5]|uniref:hypothetical protein n=1 Tax=Arthrobacter sp. ISL-5 TaxID=2819111 RepID=UPI001BE850BB|nr:hypothetical protein [Arthrobacter sp. ISL-5]MBT2555489.1 hypothetical protein [Arthrobacter sp. ISL-5]
MIAGVTLRAHMNAALREPFLDHGRDVHEGLDHDSGDPFGEEPTQPLLLSWKLAGSQRYLLGRGALSAGKPKTRVFRP